MIAGENFLIYGIVLWIAQELSVLNDVNFVLFLLQFTSDTGIIHRPPCLTKKKKPSGNLFWESWMTGCDVHAGCLLKLCSLLTNQSRLLSCCVKQAFHFILRATGKHGNTGMGTEMGWAKPESVSYLYFRQECGTKPELAPHLVRSSSPK